MNNNQVRQLPHSLEAEQAILGAMLIYPSVIRDVGDQDLVKEDFFLDLHQRIFSAMMHLVDRQIRLMRWVVTRLQDTGELNLVGGADYILKLSDTAVTSANSIYYIEMIKNRSAYAPAVETAEQIAEEGFDSASELDEIMDKAEKEILEVTRSRRTTDF